MTKIITILEIILRDPQHILSPIDQIIFAHYEPFTILL